MITGFDVNEVWLGQGNQAAYTFDFKIYEPWMLLVYIQNAEGVVQEVFQGNNATYVTDLVFDPVNGGGTLTLWQNLPENYVINMFPAFNLPDQSSSFPNKSSFNLKDIEAALDYLCTGLQWTTWLAKRSIKMYDLDDIDDFNPVLPIDITSYAGYAIGINAAGNGIQMIAPGGLPVNTADPANPPQGYAYINTTIPAIRVYVNGAWTQVAL